MTYPLPVSTFSIQTKPPVSERLFYLPTIHNVVPVRIQRRRRRRRVSVPKGSSADLLHGTLNPQLNTSYLSKVHLRPTPSRNTQLLSPLRP